MTDPAPFDGGEELDTFWSRLVDTRHDLPNLLQVIARQVTDTLGDGCVLTVLRDDGTTLDPVAVTHRDPHVEAAMRAVLEGTPSSVGEGLAGSVAADRRSILMNDLTPATVESTTPAQYLPFVRDHPMRAIVIAPMVASGRLVGTLGAVRTRTGAPYEPADLQRLEGLAERAAHAIDEATAAPQAVGVADYEAIYRHVDDGVVITTPDGHILAANPAACSILGMSERQIRLGGREAIVVHDDRFTAGLAERAQSGHVRGEMTFRRGDGTTVPVHVSSSIYVTRDRSPRAVVVFRDISEEVDARRLRDDRVAELEDAAIRDPLTGLLNRRGFALAAHQALATADRHGYDCAVMFIDVDGLKDLNDVQGHATGDDALCALADILRSTAREEDVTARWGGDEFVVLLIDVADGALPEIHRRIDAALETPGGPITWSIGVVERPAHDRRSLTELVDAADHAMYREKVVRRLQRGADDSTG